MSNILNLYDNFIKQPLPADLEKSGHMAFLAYVTPHMSSIMEYAGRTCYKSFDKTTEDSYERFLTAIVNHGHEAVIEHGNLVYIIFKDSGEKKGKDADKINRYLVDIFMYNHLLTLTETEAFYVLSGNMRMFKDLIRKYFELKKKKEEDPNAVPKFNPILNDIWESFYELPKYYFEDMIKKYPNYLPESKFKEVNPRFNECTNSLEMTKLNEHLAIINHDYFNMKIKGFVVKLPNGLTNVKRVSIALNTLHKHNTITMVITAPRYITHQLVRHRPASYAQTSQRYVSEANGEFYMPKSFTEKNVEILAKHSFNNDMSTYTTLLDSGILKEDARAVLPNAMMSTIVVTMTVEEIKHMISLRAADSAQNYFRDEIARPLEAYLDNYYKSMDAPFRERKSPVEARQPQKSQQQTEAKKKYEARKNHADNKKNGNGKKQQHHNVKNNNVPNKGNKNNGSKSSNKANNSNKPKNSSNNRNNKPQKKNNNRPHGNNTVKGK